MPIFPQLLGAVVPMVLLQIFLETSTVTDYFSYEPFLLVGLAVQPQDIPLLWNAPHSTVVEWGARNWAMQCLA